MESESSCQFVCVIRESKSYNLRFGWACNVDSLYNNFENVGQMPIEILRRGPFKGPVMFIGGEYAKFLE